MSRSQKPPRIQDVAKAAGVSVATVSRAMSNPSIVAEPTRLAVEEAIRQTGYVLNLTARNLRQQSVGGVLALVPRLSNPFFSSILSGIAEVLREKDLNLLILDTKTDDGPLRPEAIGAYLNRSRADGVIVLDGGLSADLFRQPNCPPVIQACEWVGGLDAPRVLADNAEGARLAIRHLTELGHRRIAHVTGPAGNSLTVARREGVAQGLAKAGLQISDALTVQGNFTLESGRHAAQQILQATERPTAAFCDNDLMAIGLMNELLRAGLRLPRDLSIVGFDNIEMASFTIPALTTVRQHRTRIGRHAALALLDAMAGKTCPSEEILPVDLTIRASTSRPGEDPAP
ncbi:MAG: LacI family DNA-binding transcriptional regulator [Paracoccus sp. (in: a-proteobacteria)]|nr:LacI family DNA-binding transcriptional regulator [Paracoccus sp. (in: a-proteobacteria)]